jgi:lysophospholipase L1-like esterase
MAFNDGFDSEKHIFQHNDLWTSFYVHSSLSQPSKSEFVTLFHKRLKALKASILEADVVFITLGTAHIYEHLKLGMVVSNCHKVPQKEFQKKSLSQETISKDLQEIIDKVSAVNPHARVVLTLSPVRYLRDGFEENQWSKSLQYISIKECVRYNTKTYYFPSYEYVLDDLRDYRFYKEDLVHPNQLALHYIWSKIIESFFSTETQDTLKQVEKINKRLQHKFFHPDSSESTRFIEKTKQLIEGLATQFQNIQF